MTGLVFLGEPTSRRVSGAEGAMERLAFLGVPFGRRATEVVAR